MKCLCLDGMEPLGSGLPYRGIVMRAALADFDEAEFDQNGDDFIGLEDGNIAHNSSDSDVLNPNKLRLQCRLTIFQKH